MEYGYSVHNDSVSPDVVGNLHGHPIFAWDGVLNEYEVPTGILSLVPWSVTEDWKEHKNGGGFVHKSSSVRADVWMDAGSAAFGGSHIEGNVRLVGKARVDGQHLSNDSVVTREEREPMEKLEERIRRFAVATCKAVGCSGKEPHMNDSHDLRALDMPNYLEQAKQRRFTDLTQVTELV